MGTLVFPLLYTALRVLTAGISPVPGAVPVDPLPVLLALEDGRMRRCLYLPGLVLGDVLCGMDTGVILMRLAAVMVLSLLSFEGGFHRRAWLWTFHLSLVTGIAVDLHHLYPLGFVTLVTGVQGFLWWGLLAPRTGGGTLFPLWPLLFPPAALLLIHLLLPAPALWPLPRLGDSSSGWVVGLAVLVLLEPCIGHLGRCGTVWDGLGRLTKCRKKDVVSVF